MLHLALPAVHVLEQLDPLRSVERRDARAQRLLVMRADGRCIAAPDDGAARHRYCRKDTRPRHRARPELVRHLHALGARECGGVG